jgi:hypothetical protein
MTKYSWTTDQASHLDHERIIYNHPEAAAQVHQVEAPLSSRIIANA